MWHGRNIPERVLVEWGKHTMVDATRALLRNALADPLNQKFMLLSEAGVPLYSPQVVYHQLMTEAKSRLMACVTPTVCICPYGNAGVVWGLQGLIHSVLFCRIGLLVQHQCMRPGQKATA